MIKYTFRAKTCHCVEKHTANKVFQCIENKFIAFSDFPLLTMHEKIQIRNKCYRIKVRFKTMHSMVIKCNLYLFISIGNRPCMARLLHVHIVIMFMNFLYNFCIISTNIKFRRHQSVMDITAGQ